MMRAKSCARQSTSCWTSRQTSWSNRISCSCRRIAHDIVRDRIYGPPDLTIEVLSPQPRIGQLDERVGWFARYGVRECWLADLKEKQIAVLKLSRRGGVVGRTVFSGNQTVVSEVSRSQR